MPDFDDIKDPKIKGLAMEIYNKLSITGGMTVFEILADDIYCQIGENDSFVFSIEVRGKDAEFFLFDMNFILSNENTFESFQNNILTIIKSVLKGDYEIEIFKFHELIIQSAIVFTSSLRIQLYKNVLYQFLRFFPSQLIRFSRKGKAITSPSKT